MPIDLWLQLEVSTGLSVPVDILQFFKKNQIMKLADGKAKYKCSVELHCRESLCSHHMHSRVFLEHFEIVCNSLPLPHVYFVWIFLKNYKGRPG